MSLPITIVQSVLAFMCLISACNLITVLSCSSLQPIAMHLLYSLGCDSLTAPVLCYEKSLHNIAKTGLGLWLVEN